MQRLGPLGRQRQQRPVFLPGLPRALTGLLLGKGPQVGGTHMQVATVGGVLCPSGPNPPSAFCEASGKRSWTPELTSLRCLGPEARGPQTQKESGLQQAGVRGSREAHKEGEGWGSALRHRRRAPRSRVASPAPETRPPVRRQRGPPGLAPAPASGAAKAAGGHGSV